MFLPSPCVRFGMTVLNGALTVGDAVATLAAFAVSVIALGTWLQAAFGGGVAAYADALLWTTVCLILWGVVMLVEHAQARGD